MVTANTRTLDSEELLDALEKIFLAEGYRAVTFRDLAARLGCAYRRLYKIAPNKEELFVKIAERNLRRLQHAGWKKAESDLPLAQRMREYLNVGVIAAKSWSSAFLEDLNFLDSGRIIFDTHQVERIEGLARLIEEGIENGEFQGFNSQLVAGVMMAAVRRAREPEFLYLTGMNFSDALREISRLVRFGLLLRED